MIPTGMAHVPALVNLRATSYICNAVCVILLLVDCALRTAPPMECTRCVASLARSTHTHIPCARLTCYPLSF